MFNNYLYLLRHSKELADKLLNFVITEAFTQEKDQLLFALNGDLDFPDKHIVFSTKANSPYFFLKFHHKKAKKNVVNFFQDYLPAKILDLQFCKTDRILKIKLSTCNLFFYYHGPNTNIILCNNDNVQSFKKADNNYLLSKVMEFNSLQFYKLSEIIEIKDEVEFYENRTFKFIAEFVYGVKNYSFEIKKTIINAIFSNNVSVFYNNSLNKIYFLPENYKLHDSTFYLKTFNNVNEAIIYYLNLNFKTRKISELKQKITKYTEKELERLSDKLNKLNKRIKEGNKENLYRYYGNLLLTNLYNYQKIDDETISVFCYETNKYVNIKIKKDIEIKKNIDYFFEKASNEKISYQKSVELFSLTQKEYERILGLKNLDLSNKTIEELEQIIKLNKIDMNKDNQKENEEKFNFRVYLIEGKYKLYVGRDSTNNDILTTRFAKQNDFWFHVKGTSGSHAVLRVENLKEAIPKNVLKIAASITAFHSKAKTAGIVPVVYTLKKYVVKKKGMNPGQVALIKEDVLLVKPEIPANCEYLSDTD